MNKIHLCILLGFVFIQTSYCQRRIVIDGTCGDGNIKNVSLYKPTWFWWRDYTNSLVVSSNKKADNTFRMAIEAEQSDLLDLSILGQTWRVFVTPGDSIRFSADKGNKGYRFTFTGLNAAHYNYFQLLEEIRSDGLMYKGDVHSFKTAVDSLYKAKLKFTDEFIEGNEVSADFVFLAYSEIKYEWLYNLYSIVQRGLLEMNALPVDYLDGVEELEVDDPRLLSSVKFREAAVSKYIYCFSDDPWSNFEQTLANIKGTFKSKIRDYLLTAAIGIYAKKQNANYKSSLAEAVRDAERTLNDSMLLEHIAVSAQEYLLLNKPFPDDVLSGTFLYDLQDRSMSLQDLLNQNKNKAIYIDFWASWCGACRADIAGSLKAKQYLERQDIAYLYISLDKISNVDKWKKASAKDNILAGQFLVEGDFSSPLAEFLNLQFIPRYLILDKNHVIKASDAPRPIDAQLGQLKSIISGLNRRVITFK